MGADESTRTRVPPWQQSVLVRPSEPRTRSQDSARVVLLWLVVTVANLFKPFHVDDTAHVEIARWIASDPLHPMSGLLNWSGTLAPIFDTNQPHLFCYALAAWGKVFGTSEVSFHVL